MRPGVGVEGRCVRSHAEAGMRENAYSRGIVFKLTRRFSARHTPLSLFFLSPSLFFFRPLSRLDLGSRTNTPSPFKDRVTHPIPERPPLIRVNYVLFKITLTWGEKCERKLFFRKRVGDHDFKGKERKEWKRERKKKASADFAREISRFILCVRNASHYNPCV